MLKFILERSDIEYGTFFKMVILSFNTIGGKKFQLDVEPTNKVSEIKELAKKQLGDVVKIDFIYKGTKLSDDTRVEQINFESGTFIAVNFKKAPASAAPPPTQAPAPPPQATPPPPSPAPPVETPPPQPTPVETPEEQPANTNGAPPGLPNPEKYTENLVQLEELGFEHDQCVRALLAAYNQPDRAAEYLFSGSIPPNPFGPLPGTRRGHNTQNGASRIPPRLPIVDTNIPFVEDIEILRSLADRDPAQFIQMYIALASAAFPDLGPKIQANAVPFLTMMGIPCVQSSPNSLQILRPVLSAPRQDPQLTQILSRYNQQEQEAIQRLILLGHDPLIVIQCYEAAERDEVVAANLLSQMS